MFCTGAVAANMREAASLLAADAPRVPAVFASGPGVLTERGEIDGESAATGLIWSGGPCHNNDTAPQDDLSTGDLERILRMPEGFEPRLLFMRAEGFAPDQLWGLRQRGSYPLLFGAGTYGDPGLVCVDERGVRAAQAACLGLKGISPPHVRTAHSCRLLTDPLPVTRASGALVEEIGGERALDLLDRLGSSLEGRPLVFTVIAEPMPEEPGGYSLLIRGIQGIDPARGSLMISQEVRPGTLMSFAVRDSGAARQDFEQVCRCLKRDAAGAAPRFGLYFNCSGRGRNLHGARGIESRTLRQRFEDVPIAGFQSAFEIAPFGGQPALQLYTGVLALFSSPS